MVLPSRSAATPVGESGRVRCGRGTDPCCDRSGSCHIHGDRPCSKTPEARTPCSAKQSRRRVWTDGTVSPYRNHTSRLRNFDQHPRRQSRISCETTYEVVAFPVRLLRHVAGPGGPEAEVGFEPTYCVYDLSGWMPIGWGRRTRTFSLQSQNLPLYQLSYSPKFTCIRAP